MRKKIFTSLVVGTLAAACALSFTACGGNGKDIPKGEKVDEAGWKAAIEATLKATNYTVEMSMEGNSSYTTKDESGKTVTATEKDSTTGTAYVNADSLYTKSTTSYKTANAAILDEDDKDVEYTSTNERYATAKEAVLWMAIYSKIDYKQGAPEGEELPEAKWEARSQNMGTAEAAKAALAGGTGIAYLFSQKFADSKEATEYKAVAELYSAFTYEGGKYSATLYDQDGDEYSVEASVKGGYVVGFSISTSDEDSEGDVSEKYESVSVYTFKNYEKTTVSAPKGATDAIAAKEAE